MAANSAELAHQIAELEASLAQPLPEAVRILIEQQLAALREQRTTLLTIGPGAQIGDMTMGDIAGQNIDKRTEGNVNLSTDAHIDGIAVGLNLGTIIYGRDPNEDERRCLAWYLARLAGKLSRLPLRGLEERLDHGDGVALERVYVDMAVGGGFITEFDERDPDYVSYFENEDTSQPVKQVYHPDWALPSKALYGHYVSVLVNNQARQEANVLGRDSLVSEFVAQHLNAVILGDPGSGKSTFLRHFTWALACRGLDQFSATTELFGWNSERRVLPMILPLRTLSRRIATDGAHPATVFSTLRDEMHACCMHQVDDLLSAALANGSALVLLDGLDEVPLEVQPGQSASRRETLQAVREFVQLHAHAQVVLTCRIRAFDDSSREFLGWPVKTLAPFTLGQVRHFVRAWYQELVGKAQITPAQAEQLSAALIDAIVNSPKLRTMAETPLLLTMMALVLFNKGELPRDRPQLYERILELLLGQWDQVREGQSLAEAVGLRDWGSDRIQPLLDRLSYEAHQRGMSQDGRGRVARGDL